MEFGPRKCIDKPYICSYVGCVVDITQPGAVETFLASVS